MLNHRHFDLEDDEKLVERGYISTPWPLRHAPQYVTSRISPRTWAFIDGKMEPYEYMYREDTSEEQFTLPPDFVSALHGALEKHSMLDRLGEYLNPSSSNEPW
jgi:hypothetical protein